MTRQWFRSISSVLAIVAGVAAGIVVGSMPRRAEAAACDWRRPDNDIRKLFPGADDYHPIYKRPFELRNRIEMALGYQLAGWEDLIRYYTIMKDDRRVGTIYVHLTPDNTELVVGFTNTGQVKGVILQRYQGAHKEELNSPRFLDQFMGKSLTDSFVIGKDLKPACPQTITTENGVALTVRKLLILYSIYG